MTEEVIQFIKNTIAKYPIKNPVIDFGGLLVEPQQKIFGPTIQNLFAGKEHRVFDLKGGDIVGDIYNMPFSNNSVGTALLLETLEHLPYPQKAINELYRVLVYGGVLLISTHMCWEEHKHPKDYWRFLPDGMELLLSSAGFNKFDITTNKSASEPSHIYAVAQTG